MKRKIKKTFTNHALERMLTRTSLDVTQKELIKAISNKQIQFFKRISASKSMAYIHVKNNVLKVVINRKSNRIVTFLPWKSVYKRIVNIQMNENGGKYRTFKVTLYPDCYYETKNMHSLTKINEVIGDKQDSQMNHRRPIFKDIFKLTWNAFRNTDEEHMFIKKERRKGIEAFKITSEAKEIPFVYFGTNTIANKRNATDARSVSQQYRRE